MTRRATLPLRFLLLLALLSALPGRPLAGQSAGPLPPPPRPTQRLIIAMRSGDTHLPGHFAAAALMGTRFTVERASLSARFRSQRPALGTPAVSHVQYQVALNAAFRFDRRGRLTLRGGVFTGSSFTGGWNRTGWGEGDAQLRLFVKHVYLAADPADGIRWQGGGIPSYNGQASELTGHSSDGFLIGQRVTVARPAQLFLDEIVLTAGFLGDLDRPGVGGRLDRWDELSYAQLVLVKHLGRRASLSAEAATWEGDPLFRQALRVWVPELRVVDVVHIEQYQRGGTAGRYGIAGYAEKRVGGVLSVGAGWLSVDGGLLNADRYGRGERLFLAAHRALGAGLGLAAYLTPAFGNGAFAEPRGRIDVGLGWNLLGLARAPGRGRTATAVRLEPVPK